MFWEEAKVEKKHLKINRKLSLSLIFIKELKGNLRIVGAVICRRHVVQFVAPVACPFAPPKMDNHGDAGGDVDVPRYRRSAARRC